MNAINKETDILEYVNYLQRFVIVHSYIYYELNENILSDLEYDKKCRNLVYYKNNYPDIWKQTEYYKQFGDDYEGITGFTFYHDLNDHQKEIIRSIAGMVVRRKS